MDEINVIVEKIQSVFDKTNYPDDFLAKYDQMECLASHDGRETFLVREKNSGELFVAKCYNKSIYSLSTYIELLKSFRHKGLPRYVGQFQNDTTVCIVREYIDGTPLNIAVREKAVSRQEIINICLKLSDILIYLHGQTRPVIHRDIKPTNIILQPDGNIVLIDFDIARLFDENADTDTVFFGTKGYASPEQYGFAQTDRRTDIYSFGILLRYLLTGNIHENKNISVAADLQTIIDKCTAFSPKDRFDSMTAVRAALESAKNPSGISGITLKQLLAIASTALLFVVFGFIFGRYTDLLAPKETGITFSEPLIEAAVRAQLGKNEEALTEDDLLRVKRLYIYGIQVFEDSEEFYKLKIDDSVRGQMHTLEDIRLLPNLEELHIVHQGELDISALREAKNLYAVEIKHTHLSDCFALAELKELKYICLFETDIADFTALTSCIHLESLDVGRTPVISMEQIGSYPRLESITLMWLDMDSLNGLEKMQKLTAVSLQYSEIEDMTALLKLPKLETVYAGEDNYAKIARLLKGTSVKVVKSE